jgi:hypothetical protein
MGVPPGYPRSPVDFAMEGFKLLMKLLHAIHKDETHGGD